MSVLVDKSTRLVVQGITDSAGGFHARQCMEYGTNVVAGVTPGKGGQMFGGKVPVFDTRSEERRVGKECRSLCDWSSDVCSSDLISCTAMHGVRHQRCRGRYARQRRTNVRRKSPGVRYEIGRASCRERV